ncbi:hypothetical protein HAP94_02070 [Acidithiobacillus ferrivorans]|nr:hypothetical protein [Acidithiobacillus ferrivorans]
MKSRPLITGSVFMGLLALAGCKGENPSGNAIINQQQKVVDKQSALSVGFPNIVNFQEKRDLKLIYELRDQTFTTITYLKGMHGHLHKMCDSIGYGIPYSTQYSNPDRVHWTRGNDPVVLPQADPNGLFSPPESAATWILCLDPQTDQVEPVYSEPNIVVSQFPLTDDTAKGSVAGKAIHLTAKQIAQAVDRMGSPTG